MPGTSASLRERLYRSIEVRGSDECWPWIMKSLCQGYGFISRGRRSEGKVLAHRAMWEVINGPIPDGEGHHGTVVLHTCDNRLCCNPAHLRLGTQAENVRDMARKGRRVNTAHPGSRHGNSKLDEQGVHLIRAGKLSDADAVQRYGIAKATLKNIKSGRSWRHVQS